MTPALLANENFPAPSVALLRARGFDVLYVAEGHAGYEDHEVLGLAVAQGRWVLTFDRDYGELVFARNAPRPPRWGRAGPGPAPLNS